MYIHYFATVKDRIELLLQIEKLYSLKYVRTGNFLESENSLNDLVFNSITEIEKSENTKSKQLSTNDSYIIFMREEIININKFNDNKNKKRFTINEGINPNSIEFTRSGVNENNIFVHGRFATFGNSEFSRKIFMDLKKIVKKDFTLIKSFYLGANAKKAFDSGIRFAGASVDSPKEYDLSL